MKTKFSFSHTVSLIRSHYHWVVAGVVLFMIFVCGGSSNNLTSLHIIPITEELSVSRVSFSLAMSSRSIINTLTTFFSGFIFTRFGFRKTATVGMLAAAAAYIIMASATGLSGIFLGGILAGASSGFCTTAGATRIVSDWFHKYKGTVLGLVTSASGFGGSFMCIVQTAVIEKFSWRASFLTACVFIVFGAFLLFFFVRNKPYEKGLTPLGEGEEVIGKRRKSLDFVVEGFSMKILLKKSSFYIMCAATFFSSISLYMAFSVIVAYLKDECSFSAATASGLQSFMLLFLTATKLLAGFFCDTLGVRKTAFLCHLFGVFGLFLLPFISNVSVAFFAIVLYTGSLPILSIVPPLLALTTFGYRSQPQYTGIFLSMISASNLAGDLLSNFIFDSVGSYKPAFLLAGAIHLFGAILFLLLFRMHDRDKKKASV